LAPQPLEALATIEEGMLIWFYGYSNADLTGLQLSKIVKSKTNIILTIPQFALQSYDAIDYLLNLLNLNVFMSNFK
jgi:hypothetical protein